MYCTYDLWYQNAFEYVYSIHFCIENVYCKLVTRKVGFHNYSTGSFPLGKGPNMVCISFRGRSHWSECVRVCPRLCTRGHTWAYVGIRGVYVDVREAYVGIRENVEKKRLLFRLLCLNHPRVRT